MTRSNRGQRLVSDLSLSLILTETDAPFTNVNDQTAEPGTILATVATIARVRETSESSVADAIQSNLRDMIDA